MERGLVRAIGISNFSITKTERLLQTAKIVPAVNQVECHAYLQQQKLKEYCDSKGIYIYIYSCCCRRLTKHPQVPAELVRSPVREKEHVS